MKGTRRVIAIMVAVLMLAVMLAGCSGGSSGSAQETGYEGNYISVKVSAFGIDLTGDDAAGFSLQLDAGGKGTMDIEGDANSIKWSLDGDTITITAGSDKMTGTIDGDTIYIDDVGGTGMGIMFAKEGSDAANPANYMSDEEAAYVGVWQSYAVYDALGDDASAEVAPDTLYMELNADKTAVIYVGDTDLGEQTWSTLGDFGMIDDLNITWEPNDDGTITVSYSGDDFYYDFVCSK
ncbi:MAG: hypothetical protein IJG50_06125 [Clostridia bacterium]|nr:hypothetical protein [Clostridia bacterium]